LATFTHRQGQFLAFIHLYRKLHRRSPAELDIARYFRLTPPAVHGMIVKLDELGLITREPGMARSIRVAIPPAEVPELEDVEGPPLEAKEKMRSGHGICTETSQYPWEEWSWRRLW
jgi:SOS-response transcriptional repressor LexA